MGDASLRNPHIARLVAARPELANRNVARLSVTSRDVHAALEQERLKREKQRARHRWNMVYHKTILDRVDRVTRKGNRLGRHVTRAQLTAHADPHFNHNNGGYHDYYNQAFEFANDWRDHVTNATVKNEILDGRARHLALKHMHPDYRREYERARYLARKHGHMPPPRVVFGTARS